MSIPDYAARLAALVPSSWRVLPTDVWAHALAPRTTPPPDQGFKIHVSATEEHADRVLELVAPECVAAGVDFKVVVDGARHRILNGKRQRREQSGKFMTIYPEEREFVPLVERLYACTVVEPVHGPRVLSDRRFRDSEILSYRYGGFRPRSRVRYDGTVEHLIAEPDGRLVPNERRPWFQLPDWVADPFAEPVTRPLGPESAIVLDSRFRIEGSLRFSNSGGVYTGTDLLTGDPVVVKEARPHTHVWSTTGYARDAVDLLRREHAVLLRLTGVDAVPAAISLFTDGGHTFLAQQRVPGLPFNTFCASHEMVIAPYLHRTERLGPWAETFLALADSLIDTVCAVHEAGLLVGDLSPGNLIVDPDGRRVRLVDLESAVAADEDPVLLRHAARWVTPGFFRPSRLTADQPSVSDDLYAAAMVLYSALFPVTALFALKPTAHQDFLAFFAERGVPADFPAVIDALARGSVADARAAIGSVAR